MTERSSRLTVGSIAADLGVADRIGVARDAGSVGNCTCSHRFEDGRLLVDSARCDGALASASDCREGVVTALAGRDASAVVVRDEGLEYRYGTRGVSLLLAASRFVELLGDRHETLGETAPTDPLAAAEAVRDRVDPVADVAVESGLLECADGIDGYDDVLSPEVGLSIARYHVDRTVADGTRLRDVTTLDTGSEARVYARPDGVPLYALDPIDVTLDENERTLLVDGYEAIAEGDIDGDRTASRAIEHVADGPVDPVVTSVLSKHTNGYGVLEDLFADPRVSDVYATSPVSSNPLRVVADGESMTTNVHLTDAGARALASRVRRTSGRSFSRADPTIDATATLDTGVGVRIAGVSDPVADGVAFAFRERADDRFTLPGLVANGTMRPEVAAFLSVAVERNAAALIAGTRGAGKTTLLGTLLYELPPDTRTVVIEDTPELPVEALQSVDRDVQPLRTGTDGGPEITPADALKTALRLGDGALVVGEIRGEEARVLYEAMRVGANANAVLGTIHGDGGRDVYERVVSDLNVDPSSFAATDVIVTAQAYSTPAGKKRRIAAIEEVIVDGDAIDGEAVRFEPLYELEGERAVPTGRIDRGESRLVDRLTGPTEAYADVRRAIRVRRQELEALAEDGRTSPEEVASAHAASRLD